MHQLPTHLFDFEIVVFHNFMQEHQKIYKICFCLFSPLSFTCSTGDPWRVQRMGRHRCSPTCTTTLTSPGRTMKWTLSHWWTRSVNLLLFVAKLTQLAKVTCLDGNVLITETGQDCPRLWLRELPGQQEAVGVCASEPEPQLPED